MAISITERNINMKRNVLKNAFLLMEKQNLKVGDVEEKIGVSAGYLSRLNKDDNTTKISLEQVSSLADVLGVPIDLLCSVDLSALTPNEQDVIQFIEKLAQETIAGIRHWEKQTTKDLKEIVAYTDGKTSNSLFLYDAKNKQIYYNSAFAKDKGTIVSGDIFESGIGNGNWIKLVRVKYPEKNSLDFEIYLIHYIDEPMYVGSALHPVCASDSVEENELFVVMKKLYGTATEAAKHVHFTDFVKSAIGEFLNPSTITQDISDDVDIDNMDDVPY